MKNQYFGDINDYKKYGLLRALAEGGRNKIAVCWMLTEPDGSTAGNRTSYLQQPERWRKLDPGLFDLLSRAVALQQRNVAFAKRRNLIPGAVYHAEILSNDALARRKYFDRLRACAAGCDLIFFDPDNGMEVKSVPKGRKHSSKYLYWDELKDFHEAGHSVLVYQHFQRNAGLKRADFVRFLAQEFMAKTAVPRVFAFQTAHVTFFLLPQKSRCGRIAALSNQVAQRWAPEILVTTHPDR